MDIDGEKSQLENNRLLLNAIKQKSINRENGVINAPIFKPKKFVIPPLRVPPTAAANIQTKTTSTPAASSATTTAAATTAETIIDAKAATHSEPSPLNQFLLKQSRQKNINGLSDGFILPGLKAPEGSANQKTFNIPMLNRLQMDNSALLQENHHIEKGIQNLSINSKNYWIEHKQQIKIPSPSPSSSSNTKKTDDILIDLTAALIINPNDKKSHNRPAATERKRAQDSVNAKNALEFKIPHIECDRKTKRRRNHNESKELLCTMNVSHLKYNHNSDKPTALGEALSATDKCLNNQYFPCAANSLERFHLKLYKRSDYGNEINRFRFDTKSPDDLVKESLANCQRISYT